MCVEDRAGEIEPLLDVDALRRGAQRFAHLLGGVRQRIDELESQRRDLELTLEELRDIEEQVLAAMARTGLTPPPRQEADTRP